MLAYCFVLPHFEATFVTSRTLPWYLESLTSLPSMSFIVKSSAGATFFSSACERVPSANAPATNRAPAISSGAVLRFSIRLPFLVCLGVRYWVLGRWVQGVWLSELRPSPLTPNTQHLT